ncbi:hypothetical protein ACGFYU_06220 [Streptomyces sp. NPDC048337]|uniref:hypothetical protein n=1 Tax=Streptomyces sp. NPDC048337 TaxID=3365535 RepID=UPI003717F9CC
MTNHTAARIIAGAALTVLIGVVSVPAAQAAERPGGGIGGALAGPLSLDNLLSLRFLTPTVRDAKRQVTGLASGLSPAPAHAVGLGRLLK